MGTAVFSILQDIVTVSFGAYRALSLPMIRKESFCSVVGADCILISSVHPPITSAKRRLVMVRILILFVLMWQMGPCFFTAGAVLPGGHAVHLDKKIREGAQIGKTAFLRDFGDG